MYQFSINKNANKNSPLKIILLLLSFLSATTTASPSFTQLTSNLSSTETDQHWKAISGLAELGDKRAVPILISELQKDISERKGYSMAIIPALGQLKDKRAIPILLSCLNNRDDHWLGRSASALALGEIEAKPAIPDLVRAVWLADTHDAAIIALANIADPETVDVLTSVFYPGEELETRNSAINGLIKMGHSIVPQLIKKIDIKNHEQASATIEERAEIISVLGLIGDTRAIPAITKALNDNSIIIKENAEIALSLIDKSNSGQD